MTNPEMRLGPVVYFVQMLGTEFVKIGSSRGTFTERLKHLQTASPFDLAVLLFLPDPREGREQQLHAEFRDDHVRGEWFRRSAAMDRFISEAQGESWALAVRLLDAEVRQAVDVGRYMEDLLLGRR